MGIEDDFRVAVESIVKEQMDRMYKVRIGKFLSYSTGSTSYRLADIQLYDMPNVSDAQAQELNDVPILFYGTNKSIDDFQLESGDEMLVLFGDRPTDSWRQQSTPTSAIAKRKDNHSLDYAIAIPVVTIHNSLFSPTSGIRQLSVKTGTKVKVGNASFDLLSLFNDLLSIFDDLLTKLQGNVDSAGTSSTGTLSLILADLALFQSNLQTVISSLAQIADV